MRFARLLVSTSLIFPAVAASAQQAPASPPPSTGQTIIVKPRIVLDPQDSPPLKIARPTHPATEAQLREYFVLTGADRMSHNIMSAMIRSQRVTAAPFFPASFWDDMTDEVNKLDIVSIDIPIYQEYLSEEDMTAILAFYHSPAGKKLLDTQPVMISAAQVVMRARGEAIGKAVYLRHKEEIDAAKKAYDAQHAPTTPN